MNLTNLTKKLISIPSWVDNKTNEIKLADYIFDYLVNNSKLKVIKQPVLNGRYNIYAANSDTVDRLIIGHMDTVVPSNPSQYQNPFIKDGYLFGRGAADMKSGLAAMMLLVKSGKFPDKTAFLFYVDEEYNFLGMKRFIADYKYSIQPKIIISLDGGDLEITNGCRGLIQLQVEVSGKSCHSATPRNGINAITSGFNIYQKLEKWLQKYDDPVLGKTTINLGLISGGTSPNIVADRCLLTLDIRPCTTSLSSSLIRRKIISLARYEKVATRISTEIDLGLWLTPKTKLVSLGLPFKNISKTGYIDIQMLWLAFNYPVCLTFGAGNQASAHSANESAELVKLKKLLPQLLKITNAKI